MNCELFIHWNPDLVFFHLGPLAVRWYGLCWLVGFAVAYLLVRRLYREQKIKDELFDPLFIYCFMGILIGARLGHCIFYEPDYFLTSVRGIIEMFLPIRFVDGNINYAGNWLFQLTGGAAAFVGYEGLASHGGTLGLMIALWLYVKKTKLNIWTVLDNIAIATGSMACFIRLGNLMNSEIVGKVTDVPWAFLFVNGDPAIAGEPRHPGQLYEALAYFCFIFVMLWFYQKSRKDRVGEKKPENRRFEVGTGFYFGLVLTLIFTFRFFIEYTKEIQVEKEADYLLNIGQLLSIPFVIIGVICMFRRKKQ